MGDITKIQWTDRTFNPWWGCTKISPGCDRCYADAFDRRTGGGHWGAGIPRRRTSEVNWRGPIKWDKQAEREGRRVRVFCGSMMDVFDNEIPPEWRADLWAVIRETPNLEWQLLTKRVSNIRSMLPMDWGNGYPNVGLMITVVNLAESQRDIHRLLSLPAKWRGISYEPAIGPIAVYPELDWIIIGGESGPGARRMDPDWALSVIRQAHRLSIPIFFKQAGAVLAREWGCADKKGGNPEEWPAEFRVRQWPAEDVRNG